MNSKIIAALVLCLGLYTGLEGGAIDTVCYSLSGKPTVSFTHPVRVLVSYQVDNADIEFKGNFGIYDPLAKERLTGGLYAKQATVEPMYDGLRWGERFPGVYQLVIEPEDKLGFFWIDGLQYRGRLIIYQIDNKISLVNEVDIEDCIEGLMTHKLAKKELHSEALEALAICMRSQVLYQIQQKPEAFWQIWAQKSNYLGCDLENFQESIQEAVKKTRAIVLLDKGNSTMAVEDLPDLDHFEKLAQHGKAAPDILKNAFPNASLQVVSSRSL